MVGGIALKQHAETPDYRNRRRLRLGKINGRQECRRASHDLVGRVHRHGRLLQEFSVALWDHPDAFDYDLLCAHLESLAKRKAIDKPEYDFVTHLRRKETTRVEPADVIVIDGILLFVDERVRDLCDVKVFVDADADIRLIRRIERDTHDRGRPLDEIIEQYLSTVQPMHCEFVEPSKRYADVIMPRGGHNAIAIEMIVAKIQRRLQHGAGGAEARRTPSAQRPAPPART
jgi:uridine kinase